ncbi:MAG TPA: hypothetical protein VF765_16850 [Polyangiaceae bacterium]
MGVLKSLARKVGAGAARLAKRGIAGALDSASDALERAVFGNKEDSKTKEEPPDPFADIKEKQRKESGKVR